MKRVVLDENSVLKKSDILVIKISGNKTRDCFGLFMEKAARLGKKVSDLKKTNPMSFVRVERVEN